MVTFNYATQKAYTVNVLILVLKTFIKFIVAKV